MLRDTSSKLDFQVSSLLIFFVLLGLGPDKTNATATLPSSAARNLPRARSGDSKATCILRAKEISQTWDPHVHLIFPSPSKPLLNAKVVFIQGLVLGVLGSTPHL